MGKESKDLLNLLDVDLIAITTSGIDKDSDDRITIAMKGRISTKLQKPSFAPYSEFKF